MRSCAVRRARPRCTWPSTRSRRARPWTSPRLADPPAPPMRRLRRRPFCKFFCKFLAGSFSSVPKRNFAGKYAFDSIFQVLQDLHTFAPLQSQNFSKKWVWQIIFALFFNRLAIQSSWHAMRSNTECCKNTTKSTVFAHIQRRAQMQPSEIGGSAHVV